MIAPSLDALRLFELAARRLSFQLAASEAHVTPSAVSQRIRQIERLIGVRLFRRLTRQVILTEEGQFLAARLRQPLADIDAAVAALRRGEDRPVTLSTTATVAQHCLFPALARFGLTHPAVRVKVVIDDALADLAGGDADIGIRQGLGHYPGCEAHLLFRGRYLPVCAPALAAQAEVAPLIHVSWPGRFADAPVWANWSARRRTPLGTGAGMAVSHESLAIQAALLGQGLALVHQAYVRAELARGDLVLPFGEAGAIETSVSHYLVRAERPARPDAAIMWDWLAENLTG